MSGPVDTGAYQVAASSPGVPSVAATTRTVPQVTVSTPIGPPGPPGPVGPQGPPGDPTEIIDDTAAATTTVYSSSRVENLLAQHGYVAPLVADNGVTDNLAVLQSMHDTLPDGSTILINPTAVIGNWYGLSNTFNWTRRNIHMQALSPTRRLSVGGFGGAEFRPIGTIAGPLFHRSSAVVTSHMRGIVLVVGTAATNALQDESQDSTYDQCFFSGASTLTYDGHASVRVNHTECMVVGSGDAFGCASFGTDAKLIGGYYSAGTKTFSQGGASATGTHFDGGTPNISQGDLVLFTGCNFDGCGGIAVIQSSGRVQITGGRFYNYKTGNNGVPIILMPVNSNVHISNVLVHTMAGCTPSFLISYGVSGTPTANQNAAAQGSSVDGIDLSRTTAPWDVRPGRVAGCTNDRTPTVAVAAGAGTGGSVGATVTGTDASGLIVVTTGASGVAAGQLVKLTYSAPRAFSSPGAVILTPASSNAPPLNAYALPSLSTRTDFTISLATAPAAGTVYQFYYQAAE